MIIIVNTTFFLAENILDKLVSLTGILSLITTTIGLFFVWLGLRRSQRLAQLQTTPILSIEFINAANLRYTPHYLYDETEEKIANPCFRILNQGGATAVIKSITRRWIVTYDNQLPPPLTKGDLSSGIKEYKKVFLTVAPNNCSTELLSYYCPLEDRRSNEVDLCQHFETFKSEEEWKKVFFQGLIEFEDILGKRYLAAFTHVIRRVAPDAGIKIALPQYNASKLNFHMSL